MTGRACSTPKTPDSLPYLLTSLPNYSTDITSKMMLQQQKQPHSVPTVE